MTKGTYNNALSTSILISNARLNVFVNCTHVGLYEGSQKRIFQHASEPYHAVGEVSRISFDFSL